MYVCIQSGNDLFLFRWYFEIEIDKKGSIKRFPRLMGRGFH
jgi:hypothetical protein